jgi:hypothetical protein
LKTTYKSLPEEKGEVEMPWVKFEKDFEHRPDNNTIVSFKKGYEGLIKQEWADAAIKDGSAKEIDRKEVKKKDADSK